MDIFALPLGVFLLAGQPVAIDFEDLRVVQYYNSRFYAGSEPPFSASPPQVLSKAAITETRIQQTLLGRSLVIEVCVFIRYAPGSVWRAPYTLEERQEHCEVYGSSEPEQQP